MTNKRLNHLVVILVVLLSVAIVIGACRVVEKPEARDVRERICIDAKCDAYFYQKADLTFYNDDHGTVVAKVDGDGQAQFSAPTAVGTATPGLMVDCAGVSNCFEIRDAATPVFAVNDGGAVVSTGAQTYNGNLVVDGQADAIQCRVQGYSTQTNELLVLEQSDGTDKVTVSNEGQVLIVAEADSDTANYDKWVLIEGEMTGTGTKDRNYGLSIEMTRPAGEEIANGDHDEAGLKIRIDTEAITTTAGTVLRAIDAEAKADNPDGTVTNLYGANITSKSDTGAGSVDSMIALQTNTQNNAAVVTNLMSADFRLMRQAATHPTNEYVVQVRNSSTSGAGADAGIYIASDYAGSATTDAFDYGIDLSGAAINTADLRLENGETINNGTDTAVQIGGFLALTEGAVIDLAAGGTITPVASYQPITNATGGSIDTDATTAIADGAVAGAILIICNEDAQDVVIKDNANTKIGGDKTLTGGAVDCITLLWDGADWLGLSVHDN